METLISIDEQILLWVNGWSSPTLDTFFALITNKYTWIPFYFLLLLVIGFKQGWKKASIFALLLIACVGIADFTSVHFFKDVFERPRPCHQEHLKPLLNLLNGKCGGRYGFVSSHASNHFAMAIFFTFWFKQSAWKHYYLFFVWAVLIALSRVYLGVHFPSDVTVGGIWGVLVALFVLFVYQKISKR